MNRVDLIGRLTRDPELRFAAGTGTAIGTFCIAVDRKFKNKTGEKEADFINIVVFGKVAENVADKLTKGRLVGVCGRIQTSTYESDGQKRYKTEVVADEVQFLDWPKDKGGSKPSGNTRDNSFPDDDFFPVDGDDNDIPF